MKFFAAVLQWQSFFRHWKSSYFWTTAWMEPYSDYRPYYCTKSSRKKSWRFSKACQGVWNFECFTWQVMWHSSSSKSFRHGFKLKLWLWDIARKHVVEIYATWKKFLERVEKAAKQKREAVSKIIDKNNSWHRNSIFGWLLLTNLWGRIVFSKKLWRASKIFQKRIFEKVVPMRNEVIPSRDIAWKVFAYRSCQDRRKERVT